MAEAGVLAHMHTRRRWIDARGAQSGRCGGIGGRAQRGSQQGWQVMQHHQLAIRGLLQGSLHDPQGLSP